jgi:hypothetical protein
VFRQKPIDPMDLAHEVGRLARRPGVSREPLLTLTSSPEERGLRRRITAWTAPPWRPWPRTVRCRTACG